MKLFKLIYGEHLSVGYCLCKNKKTAINKFYKSMKKELEEVDEDASILEKEDIWIEDITQYWLD